MLLSPSNGSTIPDGVTYPSLLPFLHRRSHPSQGRIIIRNRLRPFKPNHPPVTVACETATVELR